MQERSKLAAFTCRNTNLLNTTTNRSSFRAWGEGLSRFRRRAKQKKSQPIINGFRGCRLFQWIEAERDIFMHYNSNQIWTAMINHCTVVPHLKLALEQSQYDAAVPEALATSQEQRHCRSAATHYESAHLLPQHADLQCWRLQWPGDRQVQGLHFAPASAEDLGLLWGRLRIRKVRSMTRKSECL